MKGDKEEAVHFSGIPPQLQGGGHSLVFWHLMEEADPCLPRSEGGMPCGFKDVQGPAVLRGCFRAVPSEHLKLCQLQDGVNVAGMPR